LRKVFIILLSFPCGGSRLKAWESSILLKGFLIITICVIVISPFTVPSYAYGHYLKIGNKYLTVESYGREVQIWLRVKPYVCSMGDKLLAKITFKSIYSALKAARDCSICVAWTGAAAICTKITLPGVATTFVCGTAYGGVFLSCSKCYADLIVMVIFPPK
jgi:hypothetical protein